MKKLLAMLLILILTASPVAAFADDTYATARTPLTGSANRIANVEQAAWIISQTRLHYGESFSFNDVVGPRTVERDFFYAANGCGKEVLGGGVGQTASTLYMALLNLDTDGVVFNQVHNYGSRFTGDYVSDVNHALVVDYGAGVDFEFTNYAADEMYIEMRSSNGYLYCSVSVSDAASVTPPPGNWLDTPTWNVPSIPLTVSRSVIQCSGNSNVLTNVNLAANSIYDTTLSTGDVFSFNAIVGPREKAYGYVAGANGRGAKVTGGGVAQVASAVWLAIKDMEDISIVEKSTYGKRYNQSYVSSSADAILTDYKAGTDFAFRYTGPGSITIYTTLNGNYLSCSITQG